MYLICAPLLTSIVSRLGNTRDIALSDVVTYTPWCRSEPPSTRGQDGEDPSGRTRGLR